jgi:hypothetical protein
MGYLTTPAAISSMNMTQLQGVDLTTATITTTQVALSTTATSIAAADTNRRFLFISNASGSTIYIGKDNTVTTSNGFAVPTNSIVEINRFFEGYTGAIFGIAASGTPTVTIMYG